MNRLAAHAGILVLLALLGLGVAQLVAAQTSSSPTSMAQVGPPSTMSPEKAALAQHHDELTPPANFPDRGLTTAQKEQKHRELRAAFEARYRTWFAAYVGRNPDVRSLQRRPMMATFLGVQPDLAKAVAAADAIVSGAARSIQFSADGGATVVFSAQQVLKGTVGPDVTIAMVGGPRPEPDFVTAYLAYADAAPLLLPGDRAILFLQRSGAPNVYEVQSYSGYYRTEGGTVGALPENPFAKEVQGLSETAFVARVRQLVR
jgi:hypothetical protein